MRLFLLECKKLLCSRVSMILLLVFACLGIAFFQYSVQEDANSDENVYHWEDGSVMSKDEIAQEVAKEKQRWTGTMDETWWKNLQKASVEAQKRIDMHIIDFEKMNALYGETWYEDYRAHQEHYVYEETEASDTKRVLYYREEKVPYDVQSIKDFEVLNLQYNYGKTMMERQPWNIVDVSYYENNEARFSGYANSALTQEELVLLSDVMNQKTFHYGDSKAWMFVLETLPFIGIFLIIWMTFIAATAMNGERRNRMLETISTCKKGKTPLFFTKLLAVMACGCFAILCLVGSLLLFAQITGNLGDAQVNITEGLTMLSIYTYQEGLLISIGVMILGVCVIGVLGLVLSTIISSSYLSLALCFAALFILNIVLEQFGRLDYLWPVTFIRAEGVAIKNFTISFNDHAFLLWQLLPCIWIPMIIVGSLVGWYFYQKRSYDKIS